MPIIKNTISGEEVTIYIEVDEAKKSPYDNMRGKTTDKALSFAHDVLDDSVKLIRACATKLVKGVNELDETTRPQEMEAEIQCH
jgi:hypothetical protein